MYVIEYQDKSEYVYIINCSTIYEVKSSIYETLGLFLGSYLKYDLSGIKTFKFEDIEDLRNKLSNEYNDTQVFDLSIPISPYTYITLSSKNFSFSFPDDKSYYEFKNALDFYLGLLDEKYRETDIEYTKGNYKSKYSYMTSNLKVTQLNSNYFIYKILTLSPYYIIYNGKLELVTNYYYKTLLITYKDKIYSTYVSRSEYYGILYAALFIKRAKVFPLLLILELMHEKNIHLEEISSKKLEDIYLTHIEKIFNTESRNFYLSEKEETTYELELFNKKKLYANLTDIKSFLRGYYKLFTWLKLKPKQINLLDNETKENIVLDSDKSYNNKFQNKNTKYFPRDIVIKPVGRELNIFLDKIIGINFYLSLKNYNHEYFNMEHFKEGQYDDMIFLEKDNKWYFVDLSFYQRSGFLFAIRRIPPDDTIKIVPYTNSKDDYIGANFDRFIDKKFSIIDDINLPKGNVKRPYSIVIPDKGEKDKYIYLKNDSENQREFLDGIDLWINFFNPTLNPNILIQLEKEDKEIPHEVQNSTIEIFELPTDSDIYKKLVYKENKIFPVIKKEEMAFSDRSKSPKRSSDEPEVLVPYYSKFEENKPQIQSYQIFIEQKEYNVNVSGPSGFLALLVFYKYMQKRYKDFDFVLGNEIDEHVDEELQGYSKKGKYSLNEPLVYFNDLEDFGKVIRALIYKLDLNINSVLKYIQLDGTINKDIIEKMRIETFINTISALDTIARLPETTLVLSVEEDVLHKFTSNNESIIHGIAYMALLDDLVIQMSMEGGFYNLISKNHFISLGRQEIDGDKPVPPTFYDENGNPFFDDIGGFFAGISFYKEKFNFGEEGNFNAKIVDPMTLNKGDVVYKQYNPENLRFVYHNITGYVGEFYSEIPEYLIGIQAAAYTFNKTIVESIEGKSKPLSIASFKDLEGDRWIKPSIPKTKGSNIVTYGNLKSIELETVILNIEDVGAFMEGARDLYMFTVDSPFKNTPVEIFNKYTENLWYTDVKFKWYKPNYVINYIKSEDKYENPEFLPWELNQTLEVLIHSNKAKSKSAKRDILTYRLKDNIDYINGLIFMFNDSNYFANRDDTVVVRRIGVLNSIRHDYYVGENDRTFVYSDKLDDYPNGFTIMYPPYTVLNPEYFLTKTHKYAYRNSKVPESAPEKEKYKLKTRTINYYILNKDEFMRGIRVAANWIANSSVPPGGKLTEKHIKFAGEQVDKYLINGKPLKDSFKRWDEYKKLILED